MREYIITEEFKGKLQVGDSFEFDKVRCLFHYDVYSNKTIKGEFILEDIQAFDLHDSSKRIDKLIYKDDDGREIHADYSGSSIEHKYNSRRTVIKFDVKEYGQFLKCSDKVSKKLNVTFNIPYVSAFSRDLRTSWGFDDSFIVRFVDKPITINCENISIIFDETASLVDNNDEPDYLFNRCISPKIEIDLNENEELFVVLNKLEDFMYDVSLVISLFVHHRIHWFAYHAQTLDENGRLVIDNHFKTKKKLSGDDYVTKVKDEFKKFFTGENLALAINRFRDLSVEEKEAFTRIAYGYLSIENMDILEPEFITAYSELEAISKLIVKPYQNTKPEELIKSAMSVHSISLSDFNFIKSPKKSDKFEWLATDYRNYLIHSNNDKFDLNEIIPEYNKIMVLLRKLIFAYLEPSLKDIPYPSKEYLL